MKLVIALIIICAAVIGASTSYGGNLGWRDQKGQVVQNTEDRKVSNGFGASVIITTDTDWEKKWNTPAATTPHFNSTNRLKIGEQGTILIFFANPESDANHNVNVTCDVKIIRPNNVITEHSGLSRPLKKYPI